MEKVAPMDKTMSQGKQKRKGGCFLVLKKTAGSSFKYIKAYFKLNGRGHLKQYIKWFQTR